MSPPPLPICFLRRVMFTPTCWLWTGPMNKAQGRYAGIGAKGTLVHRYAYELAYGPIPAGLHIDHLCCNRACVRPEHLAAVSPRQNIMRSYAIGAENSRKTACHRGHPFDEKNTYWIPKGRSCRACQYERARDWARNRTLLKALSRQRLFIARSKV